MATRDNAQGIRLGIKKGGCAGMEYTVDLVTEPNPKDDHIERDGAHVYVAPEAALFLFGTEMDFEQTTLRTGFTFRNPEPELGLRLRRIRGAEARRSQGARRGPRRRRLIPILTLARHSTHIPSACASRRSTPRDRGSNVLSPLPISGSTQDALYFSMRWTRSAAAGSSLSTAEANGCTSSGQVGS